MTPSDYLFHTSVYIFWEEQLKEHPVRQNQESPIIHLFPCLFKGMPRYTNIAVFFNIAQNAFDIPFEQC